MPVKKVEFTEQGLNIFYHLKKPYGFPDEDHAHFLRYDEIDRLKVLPDSKNLNIDEVGIPHLNKKVAACFWHFMETSGGLWKKTL